MPYIYTYISRIYIYILYSYAFPDICFDLRQLTGTLPPISPKKPPPRPICCWWWIGTSPTSGTADGRDREAKPIGLGHVRSIP